MRLSIVIERDGSTTERHVVGDESDAIAALEREAEWLRGEAMGRAEQTEGDSAWAREVMKQGKAVRHKTPTAPTTSRVFQAEDGNVVSYNPDGTNRSLGEIVSNWTWPDRYGWTWELCDRVKLRIDAQRAERKATLEARKAKERITP